MSKSLKQISKKDVTALSNKDVKEIPTACQYGNLCSKDMHRVQNENISWLKEFADGIPIWSRLKVNNCLDQPRDLLFNKLKNYEVEIPGRLISLFGNEQQQTLELKKVKDMESVCLVACILALCNALGHNVAEWSAQLLDIIISKTPRIYQEILKKCNIADNLFNISHLEQLIEFQGISYEVKQQQVATGFLYMPYGFNEFNLARALTWFFHHYQFGIIQCCNRTLAFGFNIDSEYGFFMYDCESRGFPLFKNDQMNSYILRTNHLQVLLYCMIITFNVNIERIKFFIYNVDVRIKNPAESKKLKKEIYVPTIEGSDIKKMVESKVDSGLNNKIASKIETDAKQLAKNLKQTSKNSLRNITSNKSYKLNQQLSDKEIIVNATTTIKAASKIFKTVSEKNPTITRKTQSIEKPVSQGSRNTKTSMNSEKTQLEKTASSNKNFFSKRIVDSPKKIPIDPEKRYYIIAVPKKSNSVVTTLPPTKDSTSAAKRPSVETVKVNIKRLTTVKTPTSETSPTLKLWQKSEMEIDLEKSESTLTLTNEMEYKKMESGDLNPLSLKVYLVNNRKKCGLI